jgi:hypothetical protein
MMPGRTTELPQQGQGAAGSHMRSLPRMQSCSTTALVLTMASRPMRHSGPNKAWAMITAPSATMALGEHCAAGCSTGGSA